MNYDDWKLEGPEEQEEQEHPERDPDAEREEDEERKRIAAEVDDEGL